MGDIDEVNRYVDIALASVAAIISAEAAKYSDPSEMDYRHGMQDAVRIINRVIKERPKGE